jgi:hypothetical protein
MSFSDLPAIAPAGVGTPAARAPRDIAVQRAYLRAFLDRFVRGRRSSLLERRSARWPQVRVRFRRACCS